ncbi:ribokinase [Motilibacter rhizosphaerae]|uniref:Ribokinase n=1 Tax=Motilibacter rhizosphaerae TaxID=598652 RepID=A0A4Q7NRZ8_9ACTN|nr:carbohydrate kinase family protein [Motilibacter rhizosphaerae]RZS89704.1 ribokinase [Motilibacter rhizosphaerae]
MAEEPDLQPPDLQPLDLQPLDLLCLGNITIDEAVAPDGSSTSALGGDALFAALAAALGPARVGWLAPVGTDLPDSARQDLAAAGLPVRTQPVRALPTVRNVVRYAADGTRTWEMLCTEEDFDELSVRPSDLDEDLLRSRAFLVCGMSLRAQLALSPWLRAQAAGTVYLDLQEDYLEGNEDELLALVSSCDVFLPSEVEAVALARTSDLGEAARTFRDLGPQTVVVKRAERGCLVLLPGASDLVAVPADLVEAVDSTGAGDAFCGAFAAHHALTGDALGAARAGARAARTAVSGPGLSALLAEVVAARGVRA